MDHLELERRAAERLPEHVYDYFRATAGGGDVLTEQGAAWEAFRHRPRVLRDTSVVDTATTVLGTRNAEKPMELAIPITIAGMSFGALSATAKESLGRAATFMGTSTTTGDGGMTEEERQASDKLVYQCLPSRYGFNPRDLQRADAIEVVIGQGAKPGGGGMLLGQKVSERVAAMRTLPPGIDQRSAGIPTGRARTT